MGSLSRFNLNRIIANYNTTYLFETGTWKGDSVAYALKYPFTRIYSSEIMPEIAQRARERFKNYPRVEIITHNSTEALQEKYSSIQGNCIFWLDAHFPGAEEGLKGYNDEQDPDKKLPLNKEIEIIAQRKANYNDVLLIDDLRIYEEGPFRRGNLPSNVLPPKIRNIDFIEKHFADTHVIVRSYIDHGYVVVLPKNGTIKKPLLDKLYHTFNPLLKRVY